MRKSANQPKTSNRAERHAAEQKRKFRCWFWVVCLAVSGVVAGVLCPAGELRAATVVAADTIAPQVERPATSLELEFATGASFLITADYFARFIENCDSVGRATGQFIVPAASMDSLLNICQSDISHIELALGIPPGQWHDRGGLIRIDIPRSALRNLRLPSVDQPGISTLFSVGGRTPGGLPEAVIDPVPISQIRSSVIVR